MALGPPRALHQGAQGVNFKPSWASRFFDADFGYPKSPKKLNFGGARTSKIALAPRRQCNSHFFMSFAPQPENRRFGEVFWKPFGCHLAFWAPLGAPWGVPGVPQGHSFWPWMPQEVPRPPQEVPRPPQEVPRPPGTPMEEPAYTNAPGSRILFICRLCVYVSM